MNALGYHILPMRWRCAAGAPVHALEGLSFQMEALRLHID
jgi:hypothetical protein